LIHGSDPIGILLIAISAFSVSRCTCTWNPRFSDPRCAPFPSFSPFRLHNGPCDQLSCDCHHTSRRGFGVSHFLMSRVSHLSNPRLPMRPFPRASSTVQISFSIQWLRLNRDIAYREIGVSVVIEHGTRETPIPDSPMPPVLCAVTWTPLGAYLHREIAYRDIAIPAVVSLSSPRTPKRRIPTRPDLLPRVLTNGRFKPPIGKSRIAIPIYKSSMSTETPIFR
jgi:hypothetical protein